MACPYRYPDAETLSLVCRIPTHACFLHPHNQQCVDCTLPMSVVMCSQVHSREYVDAFIAGTISADKMRQIGLPWSEELVNRTLIGVGSAVLAARLALQYGVAAMCNGGTHHAHADYGTGKTPSKMCQTQRKAQGHMQRSMQDTCKDVSVDRCASRVVHLQRPGVRSSSCSERCWC